MTFLFVFHKLLTLREMPIKTLHILIYCLLVETKYSGKINK